MGHLGHGHLVRMEWFDVRVSTHTRQPRYPSMTTAGVAGDECVYNKQTWSYHTGLSWYNASAMTDWGIDSLEFFPRG